MLALADPPQVDFFGRRWSNLLPLERSLDHVAWIFNQESRSAYLPGPFLQHVRLAHYGRKLASAAPEAEMQVLQYLTPIGGCAIDLGANFGLYSRFLAEAVGRVGVVHAVEPVPPMYDVLRSNVRRLGLVQVRTHPVAVSDVTRTINMVIPRLRDRRIKFL